MRSTCKAGYESLEGNITLTGNDLLTYTLVNLYQTTGTAGLGHVFDLDLTTVPILIFRCETCSVYKLQQVRYPATHR